MIEIEGWFWPTDDPHCRGACFREVSKLDEIKKFIRNWSVVVQAGGNAGVFPKKLAKDFNVVYTFEPEPANFQCLCRNVPEETVVKFNCALGKKPQMVSMRRNEWEQDNTGAFQVKAGGFIPTIRIDDLGLEGCDLIYLDIEGAERDALDGAEKTIFEFFPLIVTEEKGLGDRKEESIGEYLDSFGYKQVTILGHDRVYQRK